MTDTQIRLDKWLWFARFCKSRSLATALCQAGKVRINRVPVSKAAAAIKPGDVLTFPQGPHIRVVKVLAPGARRGPPTEARTLYEDLAPPVPAVPTEPTAATAPRDPGSGRPTKADRRALDQLRDRD